MNTSRRSLPTIVLALLLAAPTALAQQQQQPPLTFSDAPPASAPAPAVGTATTPPPYGAPAQNPPYRQPPQVPATFATQTPLTAPSITGPVTPASPLAGAPAALPGQLAPAPGQPGAVGPAAPPFILNQIELQYVQQTLQLWESESAKVNTFKSDFERWEYDAVWNPGSDKPIIKSSGVLSYSKPDKGSFKIDEIKRWTKKDAKNESPEAPGDFVVQKEEVGEHWVCDGKAVYEYNHQNKQLVVTPIPEALRGKSIVDGPLPFLFGAEAKKLMERYWIRVKKSDQVQVWLEAYPRRQSDALNYDFVEVMLDRKTMQPNAIQVHLPGGQQRHVYMFQSPTVNGQLDALWGGLFSAPRTPIGWKKVVVNDGELPPGQTAANPGAPTQR